MASARSFMHANSHAIAHGNNCYLFFHSIRFFFLTPMQVKSIHSSTAIEDCRTRCKPSKRENRQMATKKAAKKAPAKKAAKKAAKKK